MANNLNKDISNVLLRDIIYLFLLRYVLIDMC